MMFPASLIAATLALGEALDAGAELADFFLSSPSPRFTGQSLEKIFPESETF
jgi:hypothetical protein